MKRLFIWCWCVALAAGAAAHAAEQADGLVVHILSVDTSQFPKITADVQPRTATGGAITDLRPEHVQVVEDGVVHGPDQVLVHRLSDVANDQPTRMTVVVAIVNRRGLDRQEVGLALSGLVNRLGEGETGCVMIQQKQMASHEIEALGLIRPRARIWQPLTKDKEILRLSTKDYDLVGFDALYDMLMFALVVDQPYYSPVVVVSDGTDSASRFSRQHVISKARERGRPIFAIGVTTGTLLKRYDPGPLVELTAATGGKFYRSDGKEPMPWIYDDLKAVRRTQYRVTFQSSILDAEREQRQLSVRVALPDVGKGAVATEMVVPRDRVWDERLKQVRGRLDALTSVATRKLVSCRSALGRAGLAAVKGNKASADRAFPLAQRHYDGAEAALVEAKAAAQEALDAAGKKTASKQEQQNPTVREALAVAEQHKAEAEKLMAEVAGLQSTLEVQRAILAARQMTTAPPEEPDSGRMKQVVAAIGRHRGAMTGEQYAELHRLVSRAMTAKVAALIEAGEQDAGAELCAKMLTILPDDVEGTDNFGMHFDLARCLAKQGALAKAEAEFREALKRQPDSLPAQLGLARALQGLDRAGEALEMAARAAGGDKVTPEAHRVAGLLLFEKKDYAAAAPHLAAAVDAYPAVRLQLAQCLDRQGKADEAIEQYAKVVPDQGGDACLHARYACLLWQAGQIEKMHVVVKHARLALAGEGLPREQRARVLNALGVCLYNQGAWDEGVRQCLRAVELDPRLGQQHSVLRACAAR